MKLVMYIIQYYDKFHGVEGHIKTRHHEDLEMAMNDVARLQKNPDVSSLSLIKQTSLITREEIEIESNA